MVVSSGARRPDFFVSYCQENTSWAEWIAWVLKDVGRVVVLQASDFRAGGDFIDDMHQAMRESTRMLAVLTPEYLQSRFAMAEFQAAFARVVRESSRVLVPIRVETCELDGVYASLSYLDLVGHDEASARHRLLTELGLEDQPASNTGPSFPPHAEAAEAQAALAKPTYPKVLPKVFNLTFRRDPNFTGRATLLAQLDDHVTAGDSAATHILTGLPGIGKTALTVEYIYRNSQNYDVVWWINATDPTVLRHEYAALSAPLGLADPGASPQEALVAAVRLWLEEHSRWLVVFDNAESIDPVLDLLPRAGAGQVLITAPRDPGWREHGHVLRCGPFTDAEAATFLLEVSGSDDEAAAKALGKELGHHPLALKQAAAYVSQNPVVTLQGYRELFSTRESEMLEGKPVQTTMALALQRVALASPVARDLLNLLAFLSPDEIPLTLLASSPDVLPPELSNVVGDHLRLAEAIGVLNGYDMLTNASSVAISVHRMVQAGVRDGLRGEMRSLWAAAAVNLVNGLVPAEGRDVRNWVACARLLSHAQVATGYSAKLGAEPETTMQLLGKMAIYLQSRADLPAAAELLARSLTIVDPTDESNVLSVSRILEQLGVVLREMGDREGGRAYLQKALTVYEQRFGPRSQQVATVLVELGFALWDFPDRDLKEAARESFERALEIFTSQPGPDGRWVAIAHTGLGQAMLDLGDTSEAIRCQRRALEIFSAIQDDLEIAKTLDKLGYALRENREYEEARTSHERAIGLYSEHHDRPHHELGIAYTNLGRALAEAGLAEAEAAHEKAVEVLTASLPPGHWYIGVAERRLARARIAAETVASDAALP